MFNKAELELIKNTVKKRFANTTITLAYAKRSHDEKAIEECEEIYQVCKSIISKIDTALKKGWS